MNEKTWLSLIFLIVILPYDFLFAQGAKENFILGSKYGIAGYYNYNMHSVDLRQLTSVSDSVPRSATGNQTGFSVALFYEYRMTDRTSFMLRAIFSQHPAEMNGTSPEKLKFMGSDTNGFVNHNLKTNLTNIRIEPLLKYRLFQKFAFSLGANLGIRFDKSIEHKLTPFEPNGASFTDGTFIKQGIGTNKEDDLGLQAGLVFGASYDIPVNFNGKLIITPEINFETGFSDITSDISWDVNSVRVGFTFMYSKNPTVEPEIEEVKEFKENIRMINVESAVIEKEFLKKGTPFITKDTVLKEYDLIITESMNRIDTLFYPKKSPVTKTTLNQKTDSTKQIQSCLKLSASGFDGFNESPIQTLKVEEFLSTSIQPLLNYVFFEFNSAILSSRYEMLNEDETSLFKIEDLYRMSTLRTYYHILNIIGKRMTDNPDSKIKLTGCNSGADEAIVNPELSKQRVEAVKNYLVKIWKIEISRIETVVMNLPEKFSNTNESDGLDENRRVEISSDNWEIIAPVTINDVLRDVKPNQIRFYNNANLCYQIAEWQLDILQNGTPLMTFKGEGKIPDKLTWRLSDAKQTIPSRSDSISYRYLFKDFNNNRVYTPTQKFAVEQITIEKKNIEQESDKKVDKYSLILFDFDKAVLNPSNEKIMDFVNGKIQSNSKVLIQGYTDRVGNDDYNKALSLRRAGAVASKIIKTSDIKYDGLGESDLIYNNELPEGRFYCRTVMITVETPLEK